MFHRLASEKARAAAQAEADAQYEVQSEVSRILSAERAVAQESLQQAIVRERIATEDERLRAQIFVSTWHDSCFELSPSHFISPEGCTRFKSVPR